MQRKSSKASNPGTSIFITKCNRCQERFVGEIEETLAEKFIQHRGGYKRNTKLDQATGEHFNKPGNNLSDMGIIVFNKIKSDYPQMSTQERDSRNIMKLNTRYRKL